MSSAMRRDCWDVRVFRLAVGAVCVLIAASSVGGLAASIFVGPPSWSFIGFEAVILIAAGVGAAEAFRFSRTGPAMALLCVAGAVGVGSLLGYIGAGQLLMGRNMLPFLLARAGAAGLLAAAAGLIVLSRDLPRSIPALIKGVMLGAVLVAILATVWTMRATILSAGGAARVTIALLLGVVAIGLLAAAVHQLVRAFAVGNEPRFDPVEAQGQ
jgi:hypothetical protein